LCLFVSLLYEEVNPHDKWSVTSANRINTVHNIMMK
jgi:hypothetical protein